MQATELAYLAGVVDGEGCISIYQSTRAGAVTVSVTISQADRRLIDWIDVRYPGSRSIQQHKSPNPKNPENARPAYRWILYGDKALVFLKDVREYLVLKKEQAELAIELLEKCRPGVGKKPAPSQKSRAHEIIELNHALNKRGV